MGKKESQDRILKRIRTSTKWCTNWWMKTLKEKAGGKIEKIIKSNPLEKMEDK